jgi:site-specific DNA-methyltransferase (adenine-specific)
VSLDLKGCGLNRLKNAEFYDDGVVSIYHGDCRELMPLMPKKSIDLVLTDPVWPGCDVELPGRGQEAALLKRMSEEAWFMCGRLIVILGLDVDPRFLNSVSPEWPFVRVCRMRRIPPQYRGPILYDADYAYVFGHRKMAMKGMKVLPGECHATSKGSRDYGNNHPCPRCYAHIEWLVKWYSKPGQTILDPFAGSGLVGRAAKALGRKAVLIDIEEQYCQIAERMCTQETMDLKV